MSDLSVSYQDPAALRGYVANARTHSPKQVSEIAGSIERFGFANPIILDAGGEIIAGHGRLAAALQLGLARVPTITLAGLTPEQARGLRLADNRLALNSGWDEALLAQELADLQGLDFDLAGLGFDLDELAGLQAIFEADSWKPDEPPDEPPGVAPPTVEPRIAIRISIPGQVWLGKRQEILALLDRVKVAYLADYVVKE